MEAAGLRPPQPVGARAVTTHGLSCKTAPCRLVPRVRVVPQAQRVEAYLEGTGRSWERGGQLHRIEF